jgi:hypothetical protein
VSFFFPEKRGLTLDLVIHFTDVMDSKVGVASSEPSANFSSTVNSIVKEISSFSKI